MDICYSFLDTCSLVDLAPCPPPDTEARTFYEYLATRNLTMQVVRHIAVRCGISIIPPTTRIENTTTLWNNPKFLFPVCKGSVLVIIIILVVVRRRSWHRRIKREHPYSFNLQGPVTNRSTAEIKPVDPKEDSTAETNDNKLNRTSQEPTVESINNKVCVNENVIEKDRVNQNGNGMTGQIEPSEQGTRL
ncbi:hypothetical protein MAR_001033 [Mya arenaria]|uniref:Uncharacterized protein n=1 Tax=Mya arenaria TaxID=6604 RepID=A0ABY7FAQ5_MYAAR|nr:hypothetical protein MAR_001033 [Mya arenaria]